MLTYWHFVTISLKHGKQFCMYVSSRCSYHSNVMLQRGHAKQQE